MNQIYCALVTGMMLTDEIRTALLMASHDLMKRNVRKARLTKQHHGVAGHLKTDYKFNMLGAIGGFSFTAEFTYKGADVKAEFIVKPSKKCPRTDDIRWVRIPFFPEENLNPQRN